MRVIVSRMTTGIVILELLKQAIDALPRILEVFSLIVELFIRISVRVTYLNEANTVERAHQVRHIENPDASRKEIPEFGTKICLV